MRISARTATLAIVLAGSLTACAGSPAPPEDSTPTASPSPTAIAPAHPDPVLPLGCTDLVPDPSAVVGAPVADVLAESSPLSHPTLIAFRQVGALDCVWGGGDMTDGGGFDDDLRLHVLPDGGDAYAAEREYSADGIGAIDTAGDRSRFVCHRTDLGPLFCKFELLVEGYWVSGLAQTASSERSVDEQAAATQEVLEVMAAGIRAAGDPRPVPTRNPSDFDGRVFCAEESRGALESAFETGAMHRAGELASGIFAEVERRAEVVTCEFTSETSLVSLWTVPGAGEAVAVLREASAESVMHGTFSPADVGGLDVVVACSAAGCQAHLSVVGSLVTVTQTGVARDAFMAHLESLRVAFGLAS